MRIQYKIIKSLGKPQFPPASKDGTTKFTFSYNMHVCTHGIDIFVAEQYLQVGNHVDVKTGKWTALDFGIGGGIDSYFEYLVKGGIMFNIPELLDNFHG